MNVKNSLFLALKTLIFCFIIFPSFTQNLPKILNHPGRIQIKSLDLLNSRYRETNLSISPDGKYLYFMSGRGGQDWSYPFYTSYKGKPEFDGDIWFSTNVGYGWQAPQCMQPPINTEMGEDEPFISPDGQTVYFQSWKEGWENSGGPYYKSTLSGTTWGYPVGLGGGINQFFTEKHYATDGITISPDGNTFIVAAGEDYQGDMDLYISRKNAYGAWSYPVRLSVSSYVGDDRSPFLASDGKTLYFASNGYAGWGGLEILKTVINPDGSHEPIVNIGTPFNTVQDDYGFLLAGESAFFIRDGDIHYADLKEADPEIKPTTLVLLGKVVVDENETPTLAKIKVLENGSNLIAETNTNATTGEYNIMLTSLPEEFTVIVEKQNFLPNEKEFQIELNPGSNEVRYDISLITPEQLKKEEDTQPPPYFN